MPRDKMPSIHGCVDRPSTPRAILEIPLMIRMIRSTRQSSLNLSVSIVPVCTLDDIIGTGSGLRSFVDGERTL